VFTCPFLMSRAASLLFPEQNRSASACERNPAPHDSKSPTRRIRDLRRDFAPPIERSRMHDDLDRASQPQTAPAAAEKAEYSLAGNALQLRSSCHAQHKDQHPHREFASFMSVVSVTQSNLRQFFWQRGRANTEKCRPTPKLEASKRWTAHTAMRDTPDDRHRSLRVSPASESFRASQ